ncbi:Per1-like protein [Daedaleopsis nitida]|nr:Per1-like protein [Daedaleopsis nitida]
MILRHISLLLAVILVCSPLAFSSSGDRAETFRSCVSVCESQFCTDAATYALSFALRLTRWTCIDDCKYQCMHRITDRAIHYGVPVEQYYGKWPFWRYAGMQEPASVLFSIFNFLAHAYGARKIRKRVSREHPMRNYYLMFAFVSMNAWIWSSVFHTRDLPTTEKLDYFSAALAILYALYYTVIRLFHLYPTERFRLTTSPSSNNKSGTRFLWTVLCSIAFIAHISYLSLLPRFDYSYNMIFNLAVGMSHNLLWLAYSLPSSVSCIRRYPGKPKSYRPPHAFRPALFALLTTAATGLELFDFPPWGRILDAHSLWHLATAPIAVFWYDFLVEDACDDGWRASRL